MRVDGLKAFLTNNPLMRLEPIGKDASLVVSGKVKLNHQHQDYPVIACWVNLRLIIPRGYPRELPIFEEVGGLIPKTGDFHVNPDGTLCLGSPFRLHMALSNDSCINNIYQSFFIPYAYAALLKLQHNVGFVFGELSHGDKGEVEDLCDIFGVESKESVVACLKALSKKKRVSNKSICPCGCGKRLGGCGFHHKINKYRNVMTRKMFHNASQQFCNK